MAIVCAPAELQRTGGKGCAAGEAGVRRANVSHCCVKQLQLALVVASKLPEVLSRYRTSLLSLSLSHLHYLSLFRLCSLFTSLYSPCCSQLSLNLPAGRATSVAGAAEARLVLPASCCLPPVACLLLTASCCICPSSELVRLCCWGCCCGIIVCHAPKLAAGRVISCLMAPLLPHQRCRAQLN